MLKVSYVASNCEEHYV